MKLYLCELNYLGEYKVKEVEVLETVKRTGMKKFLVDPKKLTTKEKSKYFFEGRYEYGIEASALDIINSNITNRRRNCEQYVAVVSFKQISKEYLKENLERLYRARLKSVGREIYQLEEVSREILEEMYRFKTYMDKEH